MTVDTAGHDQAAADAGASPPRSVPLLVLAAVLVVAVVAAVVIFGVQRPPELPSLADEPAPVPTASVAWTTFRNETCIDVAAPSGEVRQLRCGSHLGELAGWDDEGLLVPDWSGPTTTLRVIDASTGEVVGTREDVDDDALTSRWDRQRQAPSRREAGQLIVEQPDGEPIWRVDAPEAYTLRASSVSPDGRWVAAVDSADRLLLLSTDGSAPVRVWATGVDTYLDPVWEGDASLG